MFNQSYDSSDFAAPAFAIGHVVQVPCIGDHELEVPVIFNGHAHVVVVLDELLEGNLSVLAVRVLKRVMKLKCVQKFREDLIFSFLTELDIWVLLCVVSVLDVIDFNDTVSVFVKFFESLLDKVLSELVHLANDTSEKFIVRNGTVTIEIKKRE